MGKFRKETKSKMSAELLNKLKHKSDYTKLIINRPEEIRFGDLRFDSGIEHNNYDFILFFAKDEAELNIHIPTLAKVAKSDCVFWVAYPKKAGKIKTNITRDVGWDVLDAIGYRPVAQISINESWSALRIKPIKEVKSSASAKKQIFEARIESSEKSGGAWVKIPFNVEEVFGKKGQVKVKARFDGHVYRGSIADMGDGPILIVKKGIREAINKQPGDAVTVEIEKDTQERTVELPEELVNLLASKTDLEAFFNSLSYTNRKEYANWISSAKKSETKAKRLKETEERLSRGIKNPFEK